MSDSQRPHGLQPTRLFRPWDFPGNRTGVGFHCLLRTYALMYDICFSLSDSLHSVKQALSSSTSLELTQMHSFCFNCTHWPACEDLNFFTGDRTCPLQWKHRVLTTVPPGQFHIVINLIRFLYCTQNDLILSYDKILIS